MTDQKLESGHRSYTQYVDWFLTAKEAQKFIDQNTKKGVTYIIKALPNSIGFEVYQTVTTN
jgi:hypothetical protein